MKTISLTHGKVALIDDEDYDFVIQHKWYSHQCRKNAPCYAIANQKNRVVRMHRLIMNAPKDLQVDHIDGNGLNNQKNNLRLCTAAENQHNQRVQKRAKTSKYKGVFTRKNRNKWSCQIKCNSKIYHLGYFKSEILAAKTYDTAAKKYFGQFAKLNFAN
jgi:hypothetical protein